MLNITSERIKEALVLATEAHKGKCRLVDPNKPYISHPVEVASMIQQYHPENENAIIGALLHDTVEDTSITFEYIKGLFGPEIANIVQEVTDDESGLESKPREELKRIRRERQITKLPTISFEAKLIRLGDKISNTSDMCFLGKGISWEQGYLSFIKKAYDKLKDIESPLVKRLSTEIDKASKEIKMQEKSASRQKNKPTNLQIGG